VKALTSLPSDIVVGDAVMRPGADDSDLLAAQSVLGVTFPADYVALLRETNGVEFTLGDTSVILFELAALPDYNPPDDDFPAHLKVFGSNGGSELFAFDTRSVPHPIVVAPHYAPGEDDILPQGHDLTTFLRRVRDGKTFGELDDATLR